MGPATWWDVDPEDDAQIDEEERLDEVQHGLVGVPLVTPEVETKSDSDLDGDTPIDGDFMQQMHQEDQSMDLSPWCTLSLDSFHDLFSILLVLTFKLLFTVIDELRLSL